MNPALKIRSCDSPATSVWLWFWWCSLLPSVENKNGFVAVLIRVTDSNQSTSRWYSSITTGRSNSSPSTPKFNLRNVFYLSNCYESTSAAASDATDSPPAEKFEYQAELVTKKYFSECSSGISSNNLFREYEFKGGFIDWDARDAAQPEALGLLEAPQRIKKKNYRNMIIRGDGTNLPYLLFTF
ncbi:hypothetical protein C5167_015832 [Papaver somniferum]|uniref:Uncharacterized protein n=1 Tax=Papaver somniferum TaxID=3469 RepID=A0A4Y7JA90_PAPSO|nr:hypothetical protein C5167_015832 [Papaver somniferum]